MTKQLASGIKEMKKVEKVSLKGNRITNVSGKELVASLNPDLAKLNFSMNKIGMESILALSTKIERGSLP